jgi:hypothetical protein
VMSQMVENTDPQGWRRSTVVERFPSVHEAWLPSPAQKYVDRCPDHVLLLHLSWKIGGSRAEVWFMW